MWRYLHYRLRSTPRAANRALSVLSKMFSLAAAWGLVADGTNPCKGRAQVQGEEARALPQSR